MAETARQRVYHEQDLWDKFWKDKHGKVVIYQHPSPWLLGWLVGTIISLFTNGVMSNVFQYAADISLVVWSLLEIFKGVNYLRRALGAIVLAVTILSILKAGF